MQKWLKVYQAGVVEIAAKKEIDRKSVGARPVAAKMVQMTEKVSLEKEG
jgi:hypothetical protein